MNSGRIITGLTKLRFYGGVLGIYLTTFIIGLYAFMPSLFHKPAAVAQTSNAVVVRPDQEPTPPKPIISGLPVRIVVPRLGIDLRVMKGEYNPEDKSWTLVDGKIEAYYAMPSVMANDFGGNTFVYGHKNRFVFGALEKLAPGDVAHIYTENKLVFTYTFTSSQEMTPDQTSIFDYQGPPQLTLQTCTGNWYELRRLSIFKFESVKEQDA